MSKKKKYLKLQSKHVDIKEYSYQGLHVIILSACLKIRQLKSPTECSEFIFLSLLLIYRSVANLIKQW